MCDEDCTVADSILEVIAATSSEWADASMVDMALSWWAAEALLVADSDLDEVTAIVDDDASWDDLLMVLLSPEISLWDIILSFDNVLLLTNGDFCASSWLAFSNEEVAAMADSCLVSDELMAVADE